MNTFLSMSDTIIVKDSFGNNIEIPVPKTPEPMQIIEFEKEKWEVHWSRIFNLLSIAVSCLEFCLIIILMKG